MSDTTDPKPSGDAPHRFDQTNGILKRFAGENADEDGNYEASGPRDTAKGPYIDPGVGLAGAEFPG